MKTKFLFLFWWISVIFISANYEIGDYCRDIVHFFSRPEKDL